MRKPVCPCLIFIPFVFSLAASIINKLLFLLVVELTCNSPKFGLLQKFQSKYFNSI
jgi:hypothetical protein